MTDKYGFSKDLLDGNVFEIRNDDEIDGITDAIDYFGRTSFLTTTEAGFSTRITGNVP